MTTPEQISIGKGKMATKEISIGPNSNVNLGWIVAGVFALMVVVVGPSIWMMSQIKAELRQLNTTMGNMDTRLSSFESNSNAMDRRLLMQEAETKSLRSELDGMRVRITTVEKSITDCWAALREHMIRQGTASIYPGASGDSRKDGEKLWPN